MSRGGGEPHDFLDAAEVRAYVEHDAGLKFLREEAARRVTDDDPAHDAAHAFRVAWWTVRLGGEAVNPRAAVAAALLHDVVNVPKSSDLRSQASALSAEVARELLPQAGFDSAAVVEIADAVRTHSFSRGETPTSPLGDALQDADRLEALGALGLFRCLATGARMGAKFFHGDDPWAVSRALDDRAYSVDHLFTKLLGLPATMRTEAGRVEARLRAKTLSDVASALGDELGMPLPPSRATAASNSKSS